MLGLYTWLTCVIYFDCVMLVLDVCLLVFAFVWFDGFWVCICLCGFTTRFVVFVLDLCNVVSCTL